MQSCAEVQAGGKISSTAVFCRLARSVRLCEVFAGVMFLALHEGPCVVSWLQETPCSPHLPGTTAGALLPHAPAQAHMCSAGSSCWCNASWRYTSTIPEAKGWRGCAAELAPRPAVSAASCRCLDAAVHQPMGGCCCIPGQGRCCFHPAQIGASVDELE